MTLSNILKRLKGWKRIGKKVNGREYFESVPDWVKQRARQMDLPGLYFLQGRDYLYRIGVQDGRNLDIRWRRRIKIGLPRLRLLRKWEQVAKIANGKEEFKRVPSEVIRRVRKMGLQGVYFFHGSHFEYRIEVKNTRNLRMWRRLKIRKLLLNSLRDFRRSKWLLVILGLIIIFVGIGYYPTLFGDSNFARWMETPIEVFGGLLILIGAFIRAHRRRMKTVRTLLILLILFTGSSYGYERLDEAGKIDEWLGRSTEEGTIGGNVIEHIPSLFDLAGRSKIGESETTPTPVQPPQTPKPTPANTSRVWIGNSYLVGADRNPIIIVNNPTASNPSWNQLVTFLKQDPTDKHEYDYDSFVCADFAEMLHNNAEKAGWRAAYVSIKLRGYSDPYNLGIPSNTGHALNAFETTDRGLVYIDCTAPLTRGSENRDKVVDVQVGKDYIPERVFPELGYKSTWGNMGRVTEIEVIQW